MYILNMEDLDKLQFNTKQESYEYNGMKVPRVTKIISECINEDYIAKWANNLGFKHINYTKALQESADYGTLVHTAIENYLKEKEINESTPETPFSAFKTWWDMLNKNNDVIILGQEFKLSCPWFGGTYDMLININNQPWLVDFKTSNHLSYRYCLQLAAYRYMLKFNNIVPDIQGIVILRLCKDKPEFEEYTLNMSIPEQAEYMNMCEVTFMSMTYAYWHLRYIKSKFNSIQKI